MAGESQLQPESVPDPTVLTTDAITRATKAERDWVQAQLDVLKERLHGIDRATEVLNETVNRTPTEITKEVSHLRELCNVRFDAQKEMTDQQNKSNALAINKSEAATTDTIAKLAELFKSTTDALAEKIDDVKVRVLTVESMKAGGQERRKSQNDMIPWVAAGVSMLALVITVLTRIFVTT